ncbi:MAG: glutamate--tRNA ligase [Candidatus Moranbacteria bacterium]|nr:glutamate--tRNA ligase [Candidatus Moranbacteria bacterium]MDD3964837.1 glutamate--tRNA ligase [Candidatus Moranbacteria bacterium]
MNNQKNKRTILEKLFPKQLPTIEAIEKRYPPRKLKEGAMVTRIAPSPTGFMHIGGIYTALISERLAHQTDGVFYLRIEDTDKKREVEGASNLIASALKSYNINTDEGQTTSGTEIGSYGPYKQSKRTEIYQAYAKLLVEKGLAYPCFSSNEELEEIHKIQAVRGIKPGYYQQWAKWRDKSDQEILIALDGKREFVIRFKSCGNINNKIFVNDIVLGGRELPENDQDMVIIKSDGLPTYHMAHIIDDHLMRTTHVIRGNEWFSSLPLHLQLFRTMGWQAPKYGHIFPIQKIENSSKRKLSKRKDPEANVAYYTEQGYPEDAVIEYLLNLANSNFENWRKANPDKNNREFLLTQKKLSGSSGPLFDFDKLNDTSKGIIARYSAEEVYEKALSWTNKYDPELAKTMKKDADYTKKILNIERNSGTGGRKDIAKWFDVRTEIEYFFDQNFNITKDTAVHLLSNIDSATIKTVVDSFIKSYNEKDSKEEWFEKIKKISKTHDYAENMKIFKENPERYKGNITDIARIFRVLLTGKIQTPDLYSIMQTMGKDRVLSRLSLLI